jgi:hypothetical protein
LGVSQNEAFRIRLNPSSYSLDLTERERRRLCRG